MAVSLPSTPAPRSATPRLIDFGGDLTPPLGGPVQRIDRLGSRWALDVTLPPMTAEVARVWISRLVQAKRASALIAFPQPGVTVGPEGAPRVNGAGQTGTGLAIDGLPAAKEVKEGWFLSVIVNGQRYLHQISAPVVANGGGEAILSIEPMLRVAPSNNAVVELATPMIEGMVQGSELGWSIDLAAIYGLSFTLAERE